ncbi:hypothetical protein HC031_32180 [Planosporangium thailandense]|uniref:CBM2 domain-containing protein n=1 Tax=Planosporangium thailandense TaxID=765197 RepID=A0ABX0Y8C3_9ACTN|nr:hypothetical protein [Planosporangium thailandense]NJC74336.1 hypothetical protein [Planosporangium thailandense]
MPRYLRSTIAVALLTVATVAVPTPARAATRLTATLSTTDNGSRWLDKYVVTNPTGTPITGWTLEFDLPTGAMIWEMSGESGTLMGAVDTGLR